MTEGTEGGAQLLEADGIARLADRFRAHVESTSLEPIRTAMDRYIGALQEAVDGMAGLMPSEPTEPRDMAPSEQVAYAGRFTARWDAAVFNEAMAARTRLFEVLDPGPVPDDLPDSVLTRQPPAAAPPDPELAESWPRRVAGALRRTPDRTVPVRALAEYYLARLAEELVPVANDAARLLAVAQAAVQWQLHQGTELDPQAAPPELLTEAGSLIEAVETACRSVSDGFARGLEARVQVPDRWETMRERAARGRTRRLESWESFEEALHANIGSEVVLARAMGRMEARVVAAARDVRAIREDANDALERLGDGLAELADGVEHELTSDRPVVPVLRSLAEDARDLFARELPSLEGLGGRVAARLEALVDELDRVPADVPDELEISEHAVEAIPSRPRSLELRDAPLEELLSTACRGSLPRWVERAVGSVTDELEALRQELTRVQNAVDFQLRAPLRGDFDRSATRDLILGIRERVLGQLAALDSKGLGPLDALADELEERVGQEAEALRSAVANREFLRIRSEIAEEEAVRQITTGLERARDAAGVAGRGLQGGLRRGGGLIASIRDWAERQLGVGDVEREEMIESLEQSLLGDEQQVVDLPPIYRQLFDVDDVPWAELLVDRAAEMEVLERAYQRWDRDRTATVAVVGEKGSGKSTLVRMARQSVLADVPIRDVAFGRSVDEVGEMRREVAVAFGVDAGTADLANAINALDPGVAVVEDLHHLFVRTLGGFDALEAFLELMAATRQTVLWLATIDEYAWQYLERAVGIDSHFVFIVNTTKLSRVQLEEAIMARHEVSGFSLDFVLEAEEAGRWARITGPKDQGELTRKEAQRQVYFQKLATVADGNIVQGLFYWLRSITDVADHALVLEDPELIDLEFLERLPLPQLHTIAAIILHGGLSEAAHQRVFQLSATESRLQLAALSDSHIIFLSEDGEYKINKVLYRPFIRLLTARNIF